MVFNPDITKQIIELFFNGVPVSREEHTNHLGVYLDSQLNFSKHISESILKATKGIRFVLQTLCPTPSRLWWCNLS